MFFLSRGWRSFWNWRRKSRSASETFIRCMNYGVREACQRWTQLRSKYSSNLKSTGVLEDVKQNIKEKTTFWLREKKKEIHKRKSSAYTLQDFLRRGKEKPSWADIKQQEVVPLTGPCSICDVSPGHTLRCMGPAASPATLLPCVVL